MIIKLESKWRTPQYYGVFFFIFTVQSKPIHVKRKTRIPMYICCLPVEYRGFRTESDVSRNYKLRKYGGRFTTAGIVVFIFTGRGRTVIKLKRSNDECFLQNRTFSLHFPNICTTFVVSSYQLLILSFTPCRTRVKLKGSHLTFVF